MPEICTYVVYVQHPGKKGFRVGTFNMERQKSFHETEKAALNLAQGEIQKFWNEHMLPDTPPPKVMNVLMGSLVFVPDDKGERE